MTAQTTTIELKGDRYWAQQLAHAHVNRLLHDFRQNCAFQSLETYATKTNFYDRSGKHIGTIYIQTSFGTEKVLVEVPAGEDLKREEMYKPDPEARFRIVPVMRSSDNSWWVACLSGTFDGPYFAFRNMFGVTKEELDDNAESSLNMKFISYCAAPCNELGGIPLLFFLSQTGIRPLATDLEWTDSSGGTEHSYAWEREPTIMLCSGIYFPVAHGYITPSSNWIVSSLHVWGAPVGVDDSTESSHGYWGEVLGTNLQLTMDSTDYDEAVTFFYAAYDAIAAANDFVRLWDNDLDDQWYESTSGTYWSYCELFNNEDSLRVERSAPVNFDASYRISAGVNETIRTQAPIRCADEGIGPLNPTPVYASHVEETYTDVFQVDSRKYVLNGPTAAFYPYYTHTVNMQKYYSTDSPAKVTGLMSAALYDSGRYTEFRYHYVGPNSQNELHTTAIPSLNEQFKHKMENVIGIDQAELDALLFTGEIFLGLVQTKGESTLKVF